MTKRICPSRVSSQRFTPTLVKRGGQIVDDPLGGIVSPYMGVASTQHKRATLANTQKTKKGPVKPTLFQIFL